MFRSMNTWNFILNLKMTLPSNTVMTMKHNRCQLFFSKAYHLIMSYCSNGQLILKIKAEWMKKCSTVQTAIRLFQPCLPICTGGRYWWCVKVSVVILIKSYVNIVPASTHMINDIRLNIISWNFAQIKRFRL